MGNYNGELQWGNFGTCMGLRDRLPYNRASTESLHYQLVARSTGGDMIDAFEP